MYGIRDLRPISVLALEILTGLAVLCAPLGLLLALWALGVAR